MAAAVLSSALQDGTTIDLIESDEIGTVGVGDATTLPIKRFNAVVGIDEADFLRATKGRFKLGIEFVDWAVVGHRYFHPFGTFGVDFGRVPVNQWWLREHARGENSSLRELSTAWVAARDNRFAHPSNDPRLVQSTYAYHFDSGIYAICEARGVRRHEGKVAEVAVGGRGRFGSVRLNRRACDRVRFVDRLFGVSGPADRGHLPRRLRERTPRTAVAHRRRDARAGQSCAQARTLARVRAAGIGTALTRGWYRNGPD